MSYQALALFDQANMLSADMPAYLYPICNHIQDPQQQYAVAATFLLDYRASPDTFKAYRREVERLLQWAWFIEKKSIFVLSRHDILNYIEFCNNPPLDWISYSFKPRFINNEPNPDWRPFLFRASKADKKNKSNDTQYQMSETSVKALFAGISTFYTYLQQEDLITKHPVKSIRQKKQFLKSRQTTRISRTLSSTQWSNIIKCIRLRINEDTKYHRHLFILSAFYLLGLRISELVPTHRHTPTMSDFFKDSDQSWWFVTVGKGNKEREIAVPDAMLDALKDYRKYLGLTSPLPIKGEKLAILPKSKGCGSIGVRMLRYIVQECFDFAVEHLEEQQLFDDAYELSVATAHWLRHTAISQDVKHRPKEHIRDDAGHENIMITDKYINTNRTERHLSARNKRLTEEV